MVESTNGRTAREIAFTTIRILFCKRNDTDHNKDHNNGSHDHNNNNNDNDNNNNDN